MIGKWNRYLIAGRRLSSEMEINFPRRPRILSGNLTLDSAGKQNEHHLRVRQRLFRSRVITIRCDYLIH